MSKIAIQVRDQFGNYLSMREATTTDDDNLVVVPSVESWWPSESWSLVHIHTGLVLVRCASREDAELVAIDLMVCEWETKKIEDIKSYGPLLVKVRMELAKNNGKWVG